MTAETANGPALVIVLAAGEGTRMKSSLAKVLHPILGKPLLGHVLDAVSGTDPNAIAAVVGHQRDRVEKYLSEDYPDVLTAVQEQQNGTGHAARCALEALDEQGVGLPVGPVLVVAGDTPLLRSETLNALIEAHNESEAAVTVLSAVLEDATGYGRIVRGRRGDVHGIVEHKDATEEQLEIKEINTGIYAFDLLTLQDALSRLSTDNSQGEQYLTDVLGIARDDGKRVSAYVAPDPDEMHGINDRVQLSAAAAMLRDRINSGHMRAGVTIVDPATTWIEPGAVIEQDAIIDRNSYIDAGTSIASEAVIGPDTSLYGTTVGVAAHVLRSHCLEVEIDERATVGPFSYLRPGTHLHPGSKVGAFCEVKKSEVGVDSKVPHLSYVGDATIGEGTNIGAATVFVNYDGVNKHQSVIGDHVRIGSDSMLVAPIEVGDGAYTAAGSVITDDVPPGALAIGRGRQVNLKGWVVRKRPGSPAAEAAARAKDADKR